MLKKIVFITTHNWDTKRLGGFHKFAEAAVRQGIETIFFSFPRPYYGIFMKREQLNKNVIKVLTKGKVYQIENSDNKILNITFPTLRLPDSFGKCIPACVMTFLAQTSLKSFRQFSKKFLAGTDCFIFESCEGIFLLDKIKKYFPDAKIIYRPSDPLVFDSVSQRLKEAEKKILKTANLSLIINDEGLAAYRAEISNFDHSVKYAMLSNGVDIESYRKKYPVPELLKKQNTILYVGAWEVEWSLLFEAATACPAFNFIVVCPNYPDTAISVKIKKYVNLFYIPGIKPVDVPAWITNCDVVMVPYVTDFYKDRPLGITAKYYQAMAAEKPIVAYCDTPKLKEVGIPVCYTYEDFIISIKNILENKTVRYSFNLKDRDWNTICKQFLNFIRTQA